MHYAEFLVCIRTITNWAIYRMLFKNIKFRVSKSCNHAITQLCKISENLLKFWTNERDNYQSEHFECTKEFAFRKSAIVAIDANVTKDTHKTTHVMFSNAVEMLVLPLVLVYSFALANSDGSLNSL